MKLQTINFLPVATLLETSEAKRFLCSCNVVLWALVTFQ